MTSGRNRAVVAGVGVLLTLVFAASARANPTMPLTSLTPADGTSIQQGMLGTVDNRGSVKSLDFQATFDQHFPGFSLSPKITVATQDVPGQDGTLARDYSVDYVSMSQSDAYPDTWSGSTTSRMAE
jgi:hypothetical protein